ncbi:MAG: hypothetical protein OHK0046_45960 [Anaerolineae bacterium]
MGGKGLSKRIKLPIEVSLSPKRIVSLSAPAGHSPNWLPEAALVLAEITASLSVQKPSSSIVSRKGKTVMTTWFCAELIKGVTRRRETANSASCHRISFAIVRLTTLSNDNSAILMHVFEFGLLITVE